MESISVREARLDDLDAIVQVHFDAFRDYFITHLGRRVMNAYYRAYLENPRAVNVVGCVDGQVVGFACGRSGEDCDVRGDFYRKNSLKVIWAIVAGVAKCDKVLVTGLLSRLGQIKDVLWALVKKSPACGQKPVVANVLQRGSEGGLVSIAVAQRQQGSGLAAQVLRLFELIAAQKGATSLKLFVYKSNARGLGFYKKMGWSIAEERAGEYVMRKPL